MFPILDIEYEKVKDIALEQGYKTVILFLYNVCCKIKM